VFEGDFVAGAASGWHVARIVDRQGKDTAEAAMAHSMAASKFGRSRDEDIVGQACETFDPDVWLDIL
jgi:hypothetical protein